MDKIWERTKLVLAESGPRLVAGFSLLPCGLVMGYTFSAFVLERNNMEIMRYGPLILGIFCAAGTAGGMLTLKFIRDKIDYWHFDALIIAAIFNFIGSGFFFAKSFDLVGAFISFVTHGITFVVALSYLHSISPKETRVQFLSMCFIWYLLGIGSAISTIASVHGTEDKETNPYWSYAWLNICCCILVAGLLIGIRVLYMMGHVDYDTSMDEDIRRSNTNGSIFANREEVITRVRDSRTFFYVTKDKQWPISFVMIFVDAINFSLFVYFVFWFSLNPTVRLTLEVNFGTLIWVVLLGTISATCLLCFFSIKVIFMSAAIGQVVIAILGMILFATVDTVIPFWLLCFLFGITFYIIKLSVIESSHFQFVEILIFLFYAAKLISIGTIYSLFVWDENNKFFYDGDTSTLMAHGFSFLIILSLLIIIVSIIMPRTFKMSLFDIQYTVLGIIFTEHNIEQLNLGYLSEGRIPTIQPTNM